MKFLEKLRENNLDVKKFKYDLCLKKASFLYQLINSK